MKNIYYFKKHDFATINVIFLNKKYSAVIFKFNIGKNKLIENFKFS